MKQTILNINHPHEALNHLYGRLRKKVYFKIEFNSEKGFREIFQTINPKNQKLNAPKKDKYYHFAYHFKNEENGHIEYKNFLTLNYQDINPLCQFIAENFEALQLTSEMTKYICDWLVQRLLISIRFTDENTDKLDPLLDPTIELLVQGINTGKNVFPQINLDVEGINRLQEKYSKAV